MIQSTKPSVFVYDPNCRAPKSGGGTYRRPVNVHVVCVIEGRGFKTIASAAERKVEIDSNVDRRYDGPRSRYGRALRDAAEVASSIEADLQAELLCWAAGR